jgi:hypothetical protein
MMKNYAFGLIVAGAIGLGSFLLSNAISPARADTAAASSAQIDALIEDIDAHKQLCDKVISSQDKLFQQCKNEHAQLVARQQQLGLSDDAVNSKTKTRGWRPIYP